METKGILEAISFLKTYPIWAQITMLCLLIPPVIGIPGILYYAAPIKKADVDSHSAKCSLDTTFGSKGSIKIGGAGELVDAKSISTLGNKIYALSITSKSDGVSTKIRVDAIDENGKPMSNFGQNGAGYIVFSAGSDIRASPENIYASNDSHLIITGTAFNDKAGSASPFIAKISNSGELDVSFGSSGIFVIPTGGGLHYGWGTTSIGDNLYTVSSQYGSGSIAVIKTPATGPADGSKKYEVFNVKISSTGMAWPRKIIRLRPYNLLYIAGKTTDSPAAQSDGFLARISSAGELDETFSGGVVFIKDHLDPKFLNSIEGMAVLPDGTAVVSGYGNEGFLIAFDDKGRVAQKFAEVGIRVLHGRNRTDASAVTVSPGTNAISVSGMESDGNSMMNGFVSFFNSKGYEEKCVDDNMIRIDSPVKTRVVDHVVSDSGAVFALVQEGMLSQSSRRAAIYKIYGP